jgi:hypothetical protein
MQGFYNLFLLFCKLSFIFYFHYFKYDLIFISFEIKL